MTVDINSRIEGVILERQIGRFHYLKSAETEIQIHCETNHNLIIGSYTIKPNRACESHHKGVNTRQNHVNSPHQILCGHSAKDNIYGFSSGPPCPHESQQDHPLLEVSALQ